MKNLSFFFLILLLPFESLSQEIDIAFAGDLLTEAEKLKAASNLPEALKKAQEAGKIFKDKLGENHSRFGDALFLEAALYQKMSNPGKAVLPAEKALEIRLKNNGEYSIATAQVMLKLGAIYNGTERPTEGRKKVQRTIEILDSLKIDDKSLLSSAFNTLGNTFNFTGQFNEAVKNYEKTIEIIGDDKSLNSELAFALENAAMSNYYLGNYDASKMLAKKAVKIYETEYGEASLQSAVAHQLLAAGFAIEGDLDKSEEYSLKAIEIYESNLGKDAPVLINVYSNLSSNYLEKGNFKKGEKALLRAFELIEKNPQNPPSSTAHTYYMFGVLKMKLSDYERALNYFEKGYALAQKSLPKEHPQLSVHCESMALCYYSAGQAQKALDLVENRLKLTENLTGRHDIMNAFLFEQGAKASLQLKAFEKAISFQNKALNLRRKTGGDDFEFVRSLNRTGEVYIAAGNPEPAIQLIREAQNIFSEVYPDEFLVQATTLRNLAEAYLLTRNFKKAISVGKESINTYLSADEISEKERISAGLDKSYFQLGMVYYERYRSEGNLEDLKMADEYFDKKIGTLQILRNEISSSNSKENLSAFFLRAFESGIIAKYELFEKSDKIDYLKEAFVLSEKSKSLLLFEAMQEADALKFAGIPAETLEREYDLGVEISFYEKLQNEEKAKNETGSDSLLTVYENRLFDLRHEYDALKSKLETDFSDYYNSKYNLEFQTVADVQSFLKNDQALIEYFEGDSSIFIFLVEKNNFQVKKVSKKFPLENWVADLRASMTDYFTSKNRSEELYLNATDKYSAAAANLYEKLLAPIADDLPERLVFVPDGVLGYVPFEMLLSQKSKRSTEFSTHDYFFKKHQIGYVYSATLWRKMSEQNTSGASKGLLAFAPSFEGESAQFASRGLDLTLRGNAMEPLKYNQSEAAAVQALFGGDVFSAKAATLEKFFKLAPKYRMLHLAGHGKANDRAGDYSFLAFTSIGDSLDNDRLYVKDLYNLDLNAEIVMLSACETGIGELKKGEGIISLARGFSYAGAKSIITSFWNVDDQKTSELVEFFYQNLKDGMSKDAALRQAKLTYLESNKGQLAHPFYWAGFVAIGDLEPLGGSNWNWWFCLGAIALFLLIARFIGHVRAARKN